MTTSFRALLGLLGLVFWLRSIPAAAQTLPGTMAGGRDFSLSVHPDGTLWAVGHNNLGQLGNGFTSSQYSWVQIGADADWVQVAAGQYHSLALKANGTLYAWGANDLGQTGTGLASARILVPTIVPGGPYTQVVAGYTHTLALQADGNAYAWGSNLYGQLGNPAGSGTAAASTSPVLVSGGPYARLVAGQYHSLALAPTGALYAWGRNDYGQLGSGATSSGASPVPTRVGTAVYVQAAAGSRHSMGLQADGTLYAWGNNSFGQLGNTSGSGTVYPQLTPRLVSGGPYTQIAAGEVHSLALTPSGALYGWGSNGAGETGTTRNLNTTADNPVPTRLGTGTYARLGRANAYNTLAAKADGTLWACGDNSYGQQGTGSTAQNVTTPAAVTTVLVTRSSGAGNGFGMAIKGDGTLWAWGANGGRFGDGATAGRLRPGLVNTAQDWVQVAVGYSHTLALKADGTLWAWGSNQYGQLGIATNAGTSTFVNTPAQVPGVYVQVAVGFMHTLALKADGTLWTWGSNENGQLGNGVRGAANATPSQVPGSYTRISAGGSFSLGLRADGSLWVWGDNYYGQLGLGQATSFQVTPAAVAGTYVEVSGGGYHTLARRADGSVWAWGWNRQGQVGSAANFDSNSIIGNQPSQVPGQYTAIMGGFYHSLALKANGTLWAWGSHDAGQLGIGVPASGASPLAIYIPTQEVTLNTNWATLGTNSGANFSFARVSSSLSFASTGENQGGALGDGTSLRAYRFDRMTPLTSLQLLPVQSALALPTLLLVPNPAHDKVQVPDLPVGSTLVLQDALGRSLRTATAPAITFDVSGLPTGVYLVRATAPNGTTRTMRLAVE